VCLCVCVCVCVFICTRMHAWVYLQECAYGFVSVHVCIYARVCIRMCVWVCICVCMYMHMHTYVLVTCTCIWRVYVYEEGWRMIFTAICLLFGCVSVCPLSAVVMSVCTCVLFRPIQNTLTHIHCAHTLSCMHIHTYDCGRSLRRSLLTVLMTHM